MPTGRTIGQARRLRRGQTDVEAKLWQALRAKRFDGVKFRRQHPIGAFVADFACSAAKLVIELDGFQHGEAEGIVRDARRTEMLEEQGWAVLRFWNRQINDEMDGVLYAIACAVRERR